MGFEIPILRVFEPGGVPIEENKLRAVIVQIAVHVVPLCDRRQTAVVEHPDRHTWLLNTDHSRPKIIGSGAIDVIV